MKSKTKVLTPRGFLSWVKAHRFKVDQAYCFDYRVKGDGMTWTPGTLSSHTMFSIPYFMSLEFKVPKDE